MVSEFSVHSCSSFWACDSAEQYGREHAVKKSCSYMETRKEKEKRGRERERKRERREREREEMRNPGTKHVLQSYDICV
jgi:hypothetical protein